MLWRPTTSFCSSLAYYLRETTRRHFPAISLGLFIFLLSLTFLLPSTPHRSKLTYKLAYLLFLGPQKFFFLCFLSPSIKAPPQREGGGANWLANWPTNCLQTVSPVCCPCSLIPWSLRKFTFIPCWSWTCSTPLLELLSGTGSNHLSITQLETLPTSQSTCPKHTHSPPNKYQKAIGTGSLRLLSFSGQDMMPGFFPSSPSSSYYQQTVCKLLPLFAAPFQSYVSLCKNASSLPIDINIFHCKDKSITFGHHLSSLGWGSSRVGWGCQGVWHPYHGPLGSCPYCPFLRLYLPPGCICLPEQKSFLIQLWQGKKNHPFRYIPRILSLI